MISIVACSFCTCLDGSRPDDFSLKTLTMGACPFFELLIEKSSPASTLDLELRD